MVNLIRAEWLKIAGNKWVTGFLLWLFPVGALALTITMGLLSLFFPSFREARLDQPFRWDQAMIDVWDFPTNILGRMFLLSFIVVNFAGEYQWGTWKNITPRRRRPILILTKFLLLGSLIVLTFVLTSIIFGGLPGVLAELFGAGSEPDLTRSALTEFLSDYSLQAALTFALMLIAAIYAALAAMLTRSIIGGIMVGLGISIAEPFSLAGLFALSQLFDNPRILRLVRFTPSYNVENIQGWFAGHNGGVFVTFIEAAGGGRINDTLAFSAWVLAAWIVLGIGLILYLFQRQDITT